MLDAIFGETSQAVSQALHGLSVRHRAIGENIANADTPGYKRLEVGFEGQMQQAFGQSSEPVQLAVTHPGHLSLGPRSVADVAPELHRVDETTGRNDGNNVDIDVEMTKLAETNISYNAMAQLAKHQFDDIRTAVRG